MKQEQNLAAPGEVHFSVKMGSKNVDLVRKVVVNHTIRITLKHIPRHLGSVLATAAFHFFRLILSTIHA